MTMNRRVPTALLVAAGLGVAACGGPPVDKNAAAVVDADNLPECPADALASADGPVKIEFWHSRGGTTITALNALVAEYNASQDEVVVEATQQGATNDELMDKYNGAVASNDLPDIVDVEEIRLQSLVDGGTLLPGEACMDEADLDKVEPAVRADYTVDGVFWPGFVHIAMPNFFYNKAHFEQAGLDPEDPPETLQEVYEAAQAIKDAGVSEAPWAFHMQRWPIDSWLTGAGVELVDNSNGRDGTATTASFDNETAREVYELLATMKDEGLLEPYSNVAGNIDHYLALATGRSSMLIETSTASASMSAFLAGNLEGAEAGVDIADLDLGELDLTGAPIPGLEEAGQGRLFGSMFAVVNRSSAVEQAAALDFLQWLEERQVDWLVTGTGTPYWTGVTEDPAIQDFFAKDLAGYLVAPAVEQVAALDPDRPGPLIGPYYEINQAMQTSLERLLLSGDSVDDVLAAAESEMNAALDQYNGN